MVAQDNNKDTRLMLAAGENLFSQGDPGGDLIFIEQGSVEIYTRRENEDVILSEMHQGEIIGVITCLTNEPRMASARAKTRLVYRKVPHESIKKVFAALPNLMKIVLKEFSARLQQMNKLYSEAQLQLRRFENSQVSSVYTGAQVASAFAAISEFMAINFDDYKIVVIDDVLQKLEFVLNIKKEKIDRIFGVLIDAGLLKQEIDPEKKRTITRLENAQKLDYFAQFVRESKHGSTKKLVRAKFTHKETRILSAIVKFAQRLNMDVTKKCKLNLRELEKSMERATGVKFESDALEKGESLKLLSIDREGSEAFLIMQPLYLGRTIACVEAIRKLSVADNPEASEEAAA